MGVVGSLLCDNTDHNSSNTDLKKTSINLKNTEKDLENVNTNLKNADADLKNTIIDHDTNKKEPKNSKKDQSNTYEDLNNTKRDHNNTCKDSYNTKKNIGNIKKEHSNTYKYLSNSITDHNNVNPTTVESNNLLSSINSFQTSVNNPEQIPDEKEDIVASNDTASQVYQAPSPDFSIISDSLYSSTGDDRIKTNNFQSEPCSVSSGNSNISPDSLYSSYLDTITITDIEKDRSDSIEIRRKDEDSLENIKHVVKSKGNLVKHPCTKSLAEISILSSEPQVQETDKDDDNIKLTHEQGDFFCNKEQNPDLYKSPEEIETKKGSSSRKSVVTEEALATKYDNSVEVEPKIQHNVKPKSKTSFNNRASILRSKIIQQKKIHPQGSSVVVSIVAHKKRYSNLHPHNWQKY